MVEAGVLLALGCAALSNVALLCKHRGAGASPDVRFGHPLQSARALFESRWWTIGFALAFVAWALHVAALAVAPISLVQCVIAGGLVLLAFPARHWFGINLGPRELFGLGLSAVGLAFLALTATYEAGPTRFSTETMAIFEGAAITVGLLLLLSGSRGFAGPHHGLLMAASAGMLLGVSDVALKALAETVPGDLGAIVSPWTAVAAIAAVVAFFGLARALQLGRAVDVILVSSVAGNVAAIIAGVLVFGDSMGQDTIQIVARSVAIGAVLGATMLVPVSPRREPVPA